MHMQTSERGFTFLEVLLSVAILSVIAGIGMPVYQSLQNRNALAVATTAYVQSLHRAQALSQAVDGDTTWGVSFTSGNITVFQGATYATRDASFDEITTVPTNISGSGVTEVVFSKFVGEPSVTGTTTLTGVHALERTVYIHETGATTY